MSSEVSWAMDDGTDYLFLASYLKVGREKLVFALRHARLDLLFRVMPFSPLMSQGLLICLLGFSFLVLPSYSLTSLQGWDIRFGEARELVREGRYAEAESSLNALLSRQPSAEGYELLGNIYEQQGKLDPAEYAYGHALKLSATRFSSNVRLGIIYGKRGKYTECVSTLEPIRKNIGNDPEALFYLCWAYLERADKAKALETAAMVERLGDRDPGALLSVGKLLVSKNLYQEAVPMLKSATSQLPKSLEAYYSLGFALFKLRKYDEMSVYLDKAHNLDPTQTKVLLLQALGFLDAGKFSEAKDVIGKARTLRPDDKYAAYLWSRVLIEEGSYPEAIKLLTDLIASGYKDPNAQLSLVTAFRWNGEFEKAANYAINMTQDYPDNPSAQLRAGLELEFLGNFQEAEKFLRKAIALSANDSEILTPAKFSLATISAKNGNNAEAVRLLGDIIRANPNDIQARVELGNIYHTTGKYQDAVTILQEALSLDPRNKRAHFLLGTIFTKLGKPKEAETQFKQFQELERSETEAKTKKPTIYTLSTK
jgi:tetratricopeptide (TPR) repeat protein